MKRLWRDDALCVGTEDRFFTDNTREQNALIRVFCRKCPVMDLCLEHAMREEGHAAMRFGVAGGLTPNQRANLARRLRKDEAS